MGDFLSFGLFLSGIIAVYLYFRHEQQQRELMSVLQQFQNHNTPVVVSSRFYGDTEVHATAEYWRNMLDRCGNEWYKSGALKVYECPFMGYVDGQSTFGQQFAEYEMDVSRYRHKVIAEFQAKYIEHFDVLNLGNYRNTEKTLN